MKQSYFAIVLLFALFAMVTFAQQAPDNLQNPQIKRDAVNQLNVYKCMHGQSEDDYYHYACCAESFAQKHANFMAKNNKFQHTGNSYQLKTCSDVSGFGENIAAGSGSFGSWSNSLERFYNEVQYWDFETNAPSTTNKGVTGHFTSIIWKAANRVALGAQYDKNSSYGNYFSLNNGSAGGTAPNMSGSYAANVTPKVKTKEECQTSVAAWAEKNQKDMQVDCPIEEEEESREIPKTANLVITGTLKQDVTIEQMAKLLNAKVIASSDEMNITAIDINACIKSATIQPTGTNGFIYTATINNVDTCNKVDDWKSATVFQEYATTTSAEITASSYTATITFAFLAIIAALLF